jgi:hypothetical protein
VRLHPRADGGQPVLLQRSELRLQPRLVGEIGQRGAPPQRQRLVEERDRGVRAAGPQRRPPLVDRGPEAQQVQLVAPDVDRVARLAAGHGQAGLPGHEQLAQGRDVHLQGVADLVARLLAPQQVDQPVGGHGATGGEEQRREQQPLLAAAERQRTASGVHLQRPQHPALDGRLRRGHAADGAIGGTPVADSSSPVALTVTGVALALRGSRRAATARVRPRGHHRTSRTLAVLRCFSARS